MENLTFESMTKNKEDNTGEFQARKARQPLRAQGDRREGGRKNTLGATGGKRIVLDLEAIKLL
jgi:hypothetical protein